MIYKKTIIVTTCILVLLTFVSGIIRLDVKETKHLKLAAQKQFDCVGQIFKDTTAGGSCVLISDLHVLSAAHCFIDMDIRPDTIQMNGKTVIVNQPYNLRPMDISKLYIQIKGQKIKVKKLTLHPNYLDSSICDIALIELEQPVKTVIPARLNTSFNELKSNVTGVGFGASGIADKHESVKFFNKKIAGENVVDSIAGYKYLGYQTLLMCDFDHPTRKDCNKMGSAVPRPLEYISAPGDSGGGLFRLEGNKWELIGICRGGGPNIQQLIKTGYYGQTMQWTRVSAFSNWIVDQKK